MAYEIPGFSFSLVAASDLSTHQYKFVNVDTTGKAALGGAGTRSIGVLQNKPTLGQIGTVVVTGVSKVVAGAAVTAGDEIMSDATGRAITAVATNQGLGVALSAAAGAGVIIPVLIRSRGTV